MMTVQKETKSRLDNLARSLSVSRGAAWSEDPQVVRLVRTIHKARREVEAIREVIYGSSDPEWLRAMDRR